MSGCTNGDEGKPAEKRRVTERKMDGGRLSGVEGIGVGVGGGRRGTKGAL